MSAPSAVAAAVIFVWVGLVLAISFLEAPLKFRAPGVTIPIGLGIGRLVFRALNTVEVALASIVLVALLVDVPPAHVVATIAGAIGVLVVQLAVVRPQLARRSNRILAGGQAPRSRAHHAYIAMEVVKVVTLTAGGAMLLAA